jgi:hypothetical protein
VTQVWQTSFNHARRKYGRPFELRLSSGIGHAAREGSWDSRVILPANTHVGDLKRQQGSAEYR